METVLIGLFVGVIAYFIFASKNWWNIFIPLCVVGILAGFLSS